MKNKRIGTILASLLILSLNQAAADETPAFDNPAQAAHAANLADEFAEQQTVAEAEAVSAAQDKVDGMSPEDDGYLEAVAELEAAQKALDTALAEIAGTTADQIADMRESGMGWGDIAHALGVHPGALGLGHDKAKGNKHNTEVVDPESEIAEATARDIGKGWGKGHSKAGRTGDSPGKGVGLAGGQSSAGSKGKGGGKDKADKSSSGNSSKGGAAGGKGSSGKGDDNGNKGGNGKGGGKGKK